MFSNFYQCWKTLQGKKEGAEHQGWEVKGTRGQQNRWPRPNLSIFQFVGRARRQSYLPQNFSRLPSWKDVQNSFTFEVLPPFCSVPELPSPILAYKLSPLIQQSPILYPKTFNQLELSVFFWRCSLSKLARMSQYSWSLSSVSKTSGHPIGHSFDFKCTLTFSFHPNTLLLTHCIASEPSQACFLAPDIPFPVAWG